MFPFPPVVDGDIQDAHTGNMVEDENAAAGNQGAAAGNQQDDAAAAGNYQDDVVVFFQVDEGANLFEINLASVVQPEDDFDMLQVNEDNGVEDLN